MKYGLDMLSPPTASQAQRMRSLGWSWCGVYVGGPRAAAHNEWHQVDFLSYPVGALASIFDDGFLPIYVGRNVPWDALGAFSVQRGRLDGDDANGLTGACGFDGGSPLCLDLEAGTWETYPQAVRAYCQGWAERVNGAGHKAYLYSDARTIAALGTPLLFDGTWGADQVASGLQHAPIGQYDPNLPPPWDAWQFGNGTLAGVSVDFNSAADNFGLARYAGQMP